MIYQNAGALIIENVANASSQLQLTTSGVTALQFTAEQSGSPLARTGAVITSVTLTDQDGNVTLTSTFLPRDR